MAESWAVTGYKGSPGPKTVFFVAEAPGRMGAVRTGIPLLGDATGRNFELLLGSVGWSREDVWITNAVLCWPARPDGKNGKPTTAEIKNCSRFLQEQISLVNPRVVVPLGRAALDALRRIDFVPESPLSELVGIAIPWADRILVPLYHPSPRVFASKRNLKQQIGDFKKLQRIVTTITSLSDQ
jgi:uracil-DNA glycosylase family 4